MHDNAAQTEQHTRTTLAMARPLRVLFTGGGTGGHLMPALAIAQTLRQEHPDAEVLFIGTADRIEAVKVPAAGFAFRAISVHGLAGRWTLAGLMHRLRAVLEIITALPVWQSLGILSDFRPDVVVGTGGYVCGPVLLAARMLRVKSVLVEQNEEVGYTSRLTARLVQVAAVISEASGAGFRARGVRTEVVGNPVRPAVLNATREEGLAALGLEPDRLTLAIIGGSLGSTPVNAAASGALKVLAAEHWFRDGWQVVHVTGAGRGGELVSEEARALRLTYTAIPFLDNIHDVLAASDVLITRGGGTFLAEIAARAAADLHRDPVSGQHPRRAGRERRAHHARRRHLPGRDRRARPAHGDYPVVGRGQRPPDSQRPALCRGRRGRCHQRRRLVLRAPECRTRRYSARPRTPHRHGHRLPRPRTSRRRRPRGGPGGRTGPQGPARVAALERESPDEPVYPPDTGPTPGAG
jgi:UDP-N-acetylglucosamine--N-acetylmuramyl-(pentapeptide) pyrophosphoryl-undecaprenol N-acetylglucosamine transferase